MGWTIEYTEDALDDLTKLDKSQIKQVLKAILRVAKNPLPRNEGGYGKPLGNQTSSKLAGCQKIKLLELGIRVVYQPLRADKIMKIIVISARKDDSVYTLAQKRI